jgi:predicted PurR-regulated permease PerM
MRKMRKTDIAIVAVLAVGLVLITGYAVVASASDVGTQVRSTSEQLTALTVDTKTRLAVLESEVSDLADQFRTMTERIWMIVIGIIAQLVGTVISIFSSRSSRGRGGE